MVRKSKTGREKENNELDQVAGNPEDEIGDCIAAVRETKLLGVIGCIISILHLFYCGSFHSCNFLFWTIRAAVDIHKEINWFCSTSLEMPLFRNLKGFERQQALWTKSLWVYQNNRKTSKNTTIS